MTLSAIWTRYLSLTQRRVIAGLALFILAIAVTGWIDSFRSRQSAKQYLREADQAKREAATALQAAARVVTKIKAAENELQKLEEKRSEALQKYDRRALDDLRVDYDRARRDRVGAGDASADALCLELAGLGYPCER